MALNIGNAEMARIREVRLCEFLELRVWPAIPVEVSRKWSRDEEDALIGYGESGEPV